MSGNNDMKEITGGKKHGKVKCSIKKVELDVYQWNLIYRCLDEVRKKAREMIKDESLPMKDRADATEVAEDITMTQILIAVQAELKG